MAGLAGIPSQRTPKARQATIENSDERFYGLISFPLQQDQQSLFRGRESVKSLPFLVLATAHSDVETTWYDKTAGSRILVPNITEREPTFSDVSSAGCVKR
jgi:hypothetical protein